MGALAVGFFDLDDQVVRAGGLWDNAGGGHHAPMGGFLPVLDLGKIAVGIVDMHGDAGILDIRAHPEPVLVAFEELVNNGFLLLYREIAAPVILADREALLDVWVGGLEGERQGVVYSGPTVSGQQEGRDEERKDKFWEGFHGVIQSGTGGSNGVDEVMDDLANLIDRLLGNVGIGLADEGPDFREALLDFCDDIIAPQAE